MRTHEYFGNASGCANLIYSLLTYPLLVIYVLDLSIYNNLSITTIEI